MMSVRCVSYSIHLFTTQDAIDFRNFTAHSVQLMICFCEVEFPQTEENSAFNKTALKILNSLTLLLLILSKR